ncbi:MAG: nucleotide exchange factor GrpE [Anaerolineae bacterium]|nr:nucleotide exchange factor GrpE [Anaerolineae bacterium]
MAIDNIEEQPKDLTGQTEKASEETANSEILDLEALRQELAQAQAQCAEYLDKYRRSVAAFDNYRKRQARDQERQAHQLTADVVRQLLPIADDLRRAVANLPESDANADWAKGVMMIEQKLERLLHGYGIVEIEAEGVAFDPAVHESLLTEPSDTYPEGTVIDVLEKGYKLGELVIRPAKVKVSTGSEAQEATDAI